MRTRVVFATYMARLPLGGNLSWALQHILGLARAGCEVTVVERADYPDACFDPTTNRLGDDASAGLRIVDDLLTRYGLAGVYAFRDHTGTFHGLGAESVRRAFREAECFIDGGNHGAWSDFAHDVPSRVLIDGEPGFTQIRMTQDRARARLADNYTHHYSNGLLLHTGRSLGPDTGHHWRPFPNPVCAELFSEVPPAPASGTWSTVMNWRAHQPLEHRGRVYGQKDMSFAQFEALPTLTDAPLEVAVSGAAPRGRLAELGWCVTDAKTVTQSVDRYYDYVRSSQGEFSIAKHVFVAARTGWFSDRSAVYLASGRPVVLQDTGFGEVLPTGEGLFAVTNPEEAAAAIDAARSNPRRHGDAARAIARDFLDATEQLRKLLSDCLS